MPYLWSPIRFWGWILILHLAGLTPHIARAALAPEKTLLLIDSGEPMSLYLGNVYADIHQIPESNIVLLPLQVDTWESFQAGPGRVIIGEMQDRGLSSQIDAIIVAPVRDPYRLSFWGHVPHEGCTSGSDCTIQYISLTTALATLPMTAQIIAGDPSMNYGFTTHSPNPYFSNSGEAIAYSNSCAWQEGEPVSFPDGQKLYLASLLGYLGENGNTPEEILEMFERSGNDSPDDYEGTFYYMETPDFTRTYPRLPWFDESIEAILDYGGQAVHWEGYLPQDVSDAAGVMTGAVSVPLDEDTFTLLPGSYGDNLTSYSAVFSPHSHTRVSEWIAAGASMSFGTVDEPYLASPGDGGKFPHPRLFYYYYQGLSLGESIYRSLEYLPFLGLVYGDMLQQPWQPELRVDVADWPTDIVDSPVQVHPVVNAGDRECEVSHIEVYLDGIVSERILSDDSYFIDPYRLGDGFHEIRFVAVDDSPMENRGRFVGHVESQVYGHSITLAVQPLEGDSTTLFHAEIHASEEGLCNIQLLQHGQVLAASVEPDSLLSFSGSNLVGGNVNLTAVARYSDGSQVASCPVLLELEACSERIEKEELSSGGVCVSQLDRTSFETLQEGMSKVDLSSLLKRAFFRERVFSHENPEGSLGHVLSLKDASEHRRGLESPFVPESSPVAYDMYQLILRAGAKSIHFPACDPDGGALEVEILHYPAQAQLTGTGLNQILIANQQAAGQDWISYRVIDESGLSDEGRIDIEYYDVPSSLLRVTFDFLGLDTEAIEYSCGQTNRWQSVCGTSQIALHSSVDALSLRAMENGETGEFIRWVVNDIAYPVGVDEIDIALEPNTVVVPAFRPFRLLDVYSNKPRQYIQVTHEDLDGEEDGVTPFTRRFEPDETDIFLIAANSGGRLFSHWRVDGHNQAHNRQWVKIPDMSSAHVLTAIYQDCPGDYDHDGDMDLQDIAAFQNCSGCHPTPDCMDVFDYAPPHGLIDENDWNVLLDEGVPTGPLP